MEKTCKWCGRTYVGGEIGPGVGSGYDYVSYCSRKCEAAAKGAGGSSSSGSSGGGSDSLVRILKLIGIVFAALAVVFTVLCYKFPKFLKGKNKKFLYAYIIAWVVLIAGAVVYFSFFSPEAVSGIKVKTVSTSCETQEKFVSLVNDALSGVSITVLDGEEFTAYYKQAINAVIEKEGKDATFKDVVYFVRLPDSVNVYIWIKNNEQIAAHVYRKNKTK
jgi:hypothetical protein